MAEPSTVIEKLAEFESSLITKIDQLPDPITTPNSSSRESDTGPVFIGECLLSIFGIQLKLVRIIRAYLIMTRALHGSPAIRNWTGSY